MNDDDDDDDDDDEYDNDNPVMIRAINADKFKCFMTSVVAEDMRRLPAEFSYSSDVIKVTPISYYMKILAGTLASVTRESTADYIALYTKVCPGKFHKFSY